jgi:hypothetical protein
MGKPDNAREILIMRLKSVHGVITDNELMDVLQGIRSAPGTISDGDVHLSDVADSELMRNYNATFEQPQ